MPAGVIRWLGSEDPEVAAARYAIARDMGSPLAGFFADTLNAHKAEGGADFTPLGQEYRVVMDDPGSYNCDGFTVTIAMNPGVDYHHGRHGSVYRQELVAKLGMWLNEHPMLAKAEVTTLQVDLQFTPMTGCVVNINDGRVSASWGDPT
jgi:hypothetical protein